MATTPNTFQFAENTEKIQVPTSSLDFTPLSKTPESSLPPGGELDSDVDSSSNVTERDETRTSTSSVGDVTGRLSKTCYLNCE